MDLAVIIGIGAFIILGIMVVLLWLSSRHEGDDSITQEIIIKANTGVIDIQADASTPAAAPAKPDTQEDGH